MGICKTAWVLQERFEKRIRKLKLALSNEASKYSFKVKDKVVFSFIVLFCFGISTYIAMFSSDPYSEFYGVVPSGVGALALMFFLIGDLDGDT